MDREDQGFDRKESVYPFNFLGLPGEYSSLESSRIAVIPVPYEATTTWIKGTAGGPAAIIGASCNIECYEVETGSEVFRLGIHTDEEVRASSSLEMVKTVSRRVSGHLQAGRFPVLLGGEHSITIGGVKACRDAFADLSVLHLDAHADSRDEYEGTPYSHACAMARVREMTPRTVSVGIRSLDSSELKALEGQAVYYCHRIQGSNDWMGEAVSRLTRNVYITIDVDVLDPSIMPATGTPEPGGMGWRQVLDLLRMTCAQKNVIGFDMVELCPMNLPWAEFTAASLVYKTLSYKFGHLKKCRPVQS